MSEINVTQLKKDVEAALAAAQTILKEAAPIAAVLETLPLPPEVKEWVEDAVKFVPTVQTVLKDVQALLEA